MSSLQAWSQSQFFGGGLRSRSLNFPSPFLDFERFYLPQTIKEIFDVLTHAYLTDSNIKPATESLATYPITELLYSMDEEDPKVADDYRDKWKELLEDHLDVRVFNIQMGLDYFLYGNAFASIYKPFTRFLVTKDGQKFNIHRKDTKWRWRNLKFQVQNPKSKMWEEALMHDELKENALTEINLVRWAPHHISIKMNPISGKREYFYEVPQEVRKAIVKGDSSYLLYVQSEIIEAVAGNARGKGALQIRFDDGEIFAMQRPMASMPQLQNKGWGLPNPISSLRDWMFKNIMRRAQAMVLHEHTIPFRIFSPQFAEQPTSMLKSSSWKREVEANYKKWINNPNQIMTSPIPINVQQVGGDRGALTLFAEMQVVNTDIIKGFGTPREFVEGGLTYSGSNVSIRMLENLLMDYVNRSERMINWIIKKISSISDLLPLKVTYQPFKMADDIQLKQLIMNMRANRDISHDLLGKYFDFDAAEQQELMASEEVNLALLRARAEAKSGVVAQRTQEYLMNQIPQLMGNYTNPVHPEQIDEFVSQMQGMPPEQSGQIMEQMAQQNPAMANAIGGKMDISPAGAMANLQKIMATPPGSQDTAMQDMEQQSPMQAFLMQQLLKGMMGGDQFMGGGQKDQQKNSVNMNQMPQQKPPRAAKTNI
jgi:hypothetical protein